MPKKPPIIWTIWNSKTCKLLQNSVHQIETNQEVLSRNHGQTETITETEGQITTIDLYPLSNPINFYKVFLDNKKKVIIEDVNNFKEKNYHKIRKF